MVLGLMSGTSLDGLDLCLTRFWSEKEQWKHEIVAAKTVEYSSEWIQKLENAPGLSAEALHLLDREYGKQLGEMSRNFLEEVELEADLIASHGHTIYHQPNRSMSVQIGHGAFLAAASGVNVANDFRSTDTAYGGEGAPLVPMAEKWLFSEYGSFLNIGGIANLSIHQKDGKVIGFDICAANQVLNYISLQHFNLVYDKAGQIASKGELIPELFEELKNLEYYKRKWPKSLGREDVEKDVLPLITKYSNGADLLHTFNKHIAGEVSNAFKDLEVSNTILISGGGAYNEFLMSLFKAEGLKIQLGDPILIDFKEALCFSLLGLLRLKAIPNILSSVSGASKDSIGGSLFLA